MKDCKVCTNLLDFAAVTGFMLRHVGKGRAGPQVAFVYIRMMKKLCPEVRKLIEEGEKNMEMQLLAEMPAELRSGESSIASVVDYLFRSEGSVT
ncbi:hypothetical protein ES705_32076 [subsurface metagenome]